MKKHALKIALLSLIISFMGTGCYPILTPESSETTTDITSSPTTESQPDSSTGVSRFETVHMDGPILVGESIDLAEKITVVYSDGTRDHNFVISKGDGYIINGSIITFEVGGTYAILVTAQEKQMRYHVTVETRYRRDFNAFWTSIEKNYTIYNLYLNNAGQLDTAGFAYHGDDEYYAMYFGSNLNHIYAKLRDGNYYAGEITELRTLVDFDFSFEPGIIQHQNLYGFQDLQSGITASLFQSTFDEYGVETISASSDIAETLLNYTVSLTYNGDARGIKFLGWIDDAKTGALFAIQVYDDNNDTIVEDLWAIEAVGTTSIAIIEEYQKTGALPELPPVELIDETVANMNLASNYTMEFSTNFYTTTGKLATEEELTAWGYSGAFAGSQTTYVTEDTVAVSYLDEPQIGFTTIDEQLYQFGYDSESNPVMVAVDGTLADNEVANILMAPTASVTDLNFSAYEEREIQQGDSPSHFIDVFASDAGSRIWAFDGANVGDEISSTGLFWEQLFGSVLFCSLPFNVSGLAEMLYGAPFITMNGETDKIYSLSSMLDVEYVVWDDGIQLNLTALLDIAWLFGDQLDMKNIRYCAYEFVFYAIGATEAPDLSVFTSTL